jgi:hypothetical protein
MHKPQPNPIVLSLFGLWILWGFGYQTLWVRLMTNVEGTVVSARDIPYPLAPARHGTEYMLRTPEGDTDRYVAGATDASLPRNIPVGRYIKKRRWQLSYEQDNHRIDDFSVLFYGAMLSAAVGILVWAAVLSQQKPA